MRRKDKEITNQSDLEIILQKAQVCRLGFLDYDLPYIVPVNYGYHMGNIYIHSAIEGKKIDIIKKNPKVCFEVELDHKIYDTGIPCKWSTSYKSIIGFGTASLITDIEEKKKSLGILIDHYTSGTVYDFSKKMIDTVAIIKITIDNMTGKQSLD
jgi:nitroimidazol reductase NimA-like FMN-containing flavoprotein (pyridoxamine 5'-phosphate oxidase superfamily)